MARHKSLLGAGQTVGLILLSCLLFKGLLSEINDPDNFLKDLLNSIP